MSDLNFWMKAGASDLADYLERRKAVTLAEVAAQLDPVKSRLALAGVLRALGAKQSWDSEVLDWVGESIRRSGVLEDAELPSCFDQDDEAVEFWQEVR
jgi:hypothetical protein